MCVVNLVLLWLVKYSKSSLKSPVRTCHDFTLLSKEVSMKSCVYHLYFQYLFAFCYCNRVKGLVQS